MRPVLLAVLGSALVAPRHAATGQDRPTVDVIIRPDAAIAVTLHDLLTDQRFLRAMESGFPLYLEYRVELRETRALWDRTVGDERWDFVVSRDPVRETFIVVGDQATNRELPSETELRRWLETVWVVTTLPLPDRGTYHYAATVQARTLSDEDVDEVFAWLNGENGDSAGAHRPGFLTRTARRLLQQVAPLPQERFEGRTPDIHR